MSTRTAIRQSLRATRLTERTIGLALILVSVSVFYASTLMMAGASQGRFAAGAMALGGVVAAFFGMPLLITGRIRQDR